MGLDMKFRFLSALSWFAFHLSGKLRYVSFRLHWSRSGSAAAGFFFLEYMDVAFNLLSRWLLGGKGHETPNPSLSSSSDSAAGFRELDSLKFVSGPRIRSSPRRIRRKWHSREERRLDKEYDVVLVPSDGGCMSGSESDDSDWSIGWLEPHAPEFGTENDTERSFAVLVPCYGRGRREVVDGSQKHVIGAVDLTDYDYSDSKRYIEEWLAEHLSA